jgi:hypothetical protein
MRGSLWRVDAELPARRSLRALHENQYRVCAEANVKISYNSRV